VSDEADMSGPSAPSAGLVEHFFRHEYGRVVAQLAHRVGVRHIELVEDAVQSALVAALTTWVAKELPRDPGAWLYRAACNHLVGDLRRDAGRRQILESAADDIARAAAEDPAATHFAGEVRDDLLRMLFVCCDEAIPRESRLVLALKTLCGFNTAEIALRLFTSEANVHKRLERARNRLRESSADPSWSRPLSRFARACGGLASPPLEALRTRLASVHEVLYLLFNEGFLSAHVESAIRRELCDEALRLATLLAEHPVGAVPETFALLALMHLHVARFAARIDGSGGLLLLEEQDRRLWDHERMRVGAEWLARSASGDAFSRYHAEAGIAAEHCFAPSFRETRWKEIADLYAMLERVAPSPLHTMNRAVAVAELQGPAAALALLDGMVPPTWLEGSYLWDAVLGDLHRRVGHTEAFHRHRARALSAAPTDAVRELLRRRWSDALGGVTDDRRPR
jgi:RNA polymerase sigma factor (sigma-70 family)